MNYTIPSKEEVSRIKSLNERFHTLGDVTEVFKEVTKKSKAVYETGRIKVIYVKRPWGYHKEYEEIHRQCLFEFEVYWDNVRVVKNGMFPKDIHSFVFGLGFGLGIIKLGESIDFQTI